VNAAHYNNRLVGGECLCRHYVAAGAAVWDVPGQLGFHRKAERQDAQAEGKHCAPQGPGCVETIHKISLPCCFDESLAVLVLATLGLREGSEATSLSFQTGEFAGTLEDCEEHGACEFTGVGVLQGRVIAGDDDQA
jgi:hypothetical protein